MKDNKLKKIKAILEIIKKKATPESKSDTFEFSFGFEPPAKRQNNRN